MSQRVEIKSNITISREDEDASRLAFENLFRSHEAATKGNLRHQLLEKSMQDPEAPLGNLLEALGIGVSNPETMRLIGLYLDNHRATLSAKAEDDLRAGIARDFPLSRIYNG